MKKVLLFIVFFGIYKNFSRNFAIVKNETNQIIHVALGLRAYGWAKFASVTPQLSDFNEFENLQKIKNSINFKFEEIYAKEDILQKELSYFKLNPGESSFIDCNIYCPDAIIIQYDSDKNYSINFEPSKNCNKIFLIKKIEDNFIISSLSIQKYIQIMNNEYKPLGDETQQKLIHAFCSFTEYWFHADGITGLILSYSHDGKTFIPITDAEYPEYEILYNGKTEKAPFPLIVENVFRDPSITRGPDGTYHLMWTTSWGGAGGLCLAYSKSKDLKTWDMPTAISLQKDFPEDKKKVFWGQNREVKTFNDYAVQIKTLDISETPELKNSAFAWAPEVIYLPNLPGEEKFMVIWTSQPKDQKMKMYYFTTKDFNDLEGKKTKLLYDPDYNVIDGTILDDNGQYYLVFKDEDKKILKITGPKSDPFYGWYKEETEEDKEKKNAITTISENDYNEGPSVEKLGNEWLVFYDHYYGTYFLGQQHYSAFKSQDLKNWTPANVSLPPGTRHGSVFQANINDINNLILFQNRVN